KYIGALFSRIPVFTGPGSRQHGAFGSCAPQCGAHQVRLRRGSSPQAHPAHPDAKLHETSSTPFQDSYDGAGRMSFLEILGVAAIVVGAAGCFFGGLAVVRSSELRRRLHTAHAVAERHEAYVVDLRAALERYLPRPAVTDLLEHGRMTQDGGRRVDITVLTVDLRGFSAFAERTA